MILIYHTILAIRCRCGILHLSVSNMDGKQKELYKKLNNGPAVLFLGQDYLRLESGKDSFLSEILRKFCRNNSKAICYDQILDCDADLSIDSSLSWMQERCNRISLPHWLKVVAGFDWSALYTSAIDIIWQNAFRSEWRELHHLFEEKYVPSDPRNRSRLHCTYLFGSVSRSEELERPPLNFIEFATKNAVAISLANRLPEIITPLGVFIIEGYAGDRDWFDPEKLTSVVNKLNPSQTHIFSANDELIKNKFVKHFVDREKIILHNESLATFLSRGEELGYIQLGKPPLLEEHGKHIQVEENTLIVPSNVWNQVSISATILDDSILEPPTSLSKDKLYLEFRNFLSESGLKPIWSGYGREFNFHREFETELYDEICNRLTLREPKDEPIILYGQTGTGKTIALGALAYRLRQDRKCPVLFIERKNDIPNSSDIDEFCRWVEDYGAYTTVIIWDGMLDLEQYYRLLRYLMSRGRRVIIVGSCYRDSIFDEEKENFIEAPAEFTQNEISEFSKFFFKFDIDFEKLLEERATEFDDTFLVALYRLLPPTRGLIRSGVQSEYNAAQEKIKYKVKRRKKESPSNTLGSAFLKAGLITEDIYLEPEGSIIGGEEFSDIEELVGLVIVPGSFGINVPLELIMRAWGRNNLLNFVEILDNIDIFRINEDDVGNLSVFARHPLEAKLLVQNILCLPKIEVEFVKKLVLEIKGNSDSEVQFAVELIRSIGPNGLDSSRFIQYYLELSKVLKALREERGVQNPRLMLQEATLLREYVVKQSQFGKPPENSIDIFNEAEGILEKAITLTSNNRKDSVINSYLLVELSSTLGSKAQHILNWTDHPKDSIQIIQKARDYLLKARDINPDNYHPLDVHIWITESILKTNILDSETRAELETDVLFMIETAETENFSLDQQINFEKRRLEIGKLLNKEQLSEKAFNSLINKGSCAGYYLKAFDIIRDLPFDKELNPIQIWSCKSAVKYLEENRPAISKDSQCLYLLLHTWWKTKTGKPLFYGERQTVNFSEDDWKYLMGILSDLKGTGKLSTKPSLIYLRGIATFHLGYIDESLSIFRELEHIPNYWSGRRRIIRSYIASNPNGTPMVFDGTVMWASDDGKKGELYVDKLRRYIRFVPREFSRPSANEHETISGFHIAFNFIGPIALSASFLKSDKR